MSRVIKLNPEQVERARAFVTETEELNARKKEIHGVFWKSLEEDGTMTPEEDGKLDTEYLEHGDVFLKILDEDDEDMPPLLRALKEVAA